MTIDTKPLTAALATIKQGLTAQHTPGPWFFDGETTEASKDWGGYGYEIFTRDAQGEVDISIAGDVLDEANARLIAAAPELLAALELAYEAMSGVCDCGECGGCIATAVVCDAIAKATGQEG